VNRRALVNLTRQIDAVCRLADEVLFDPLYEPRTGPMPHVGSAGLSFDLAKAWALLALRHAEDHPSGPVRGEDHGVSWAFALSDVAADLAEWCIDEYEETVRPGWITRSLCTPEGTSCTLDT
jgi:hypothetical protein